MFMKIVSHYSLVLALLFVLAEARPQNGETTQELDASLTSDVADDIHNSAYAYDMPAQAIYPGNVYPMDRLQMLIAQYRPNSYLRSPSYAGMNELYRMPETKRQVRYRQCYFNPISCFKK